VVDAQGDTEKSGKNEWNDLEEEEVDDDERDGANEDGKRGDLAV